MASFRCYDNSDVIKTLLMINFHLHLIKLYMVAVFPNVCLWRRSYSQNWEVLTFICQYGLRYCIVSPSFLVYYFVKIWATWENFLGKCLNAPPGKKLPVRLCTQVQSVTSFVLVIKTFILTFRGRLNSSACFI